MLTSDLFLCYWDNRMNNKYWIKKEWPTRNTMKPGEKNIINNPLIDRNTRVTYQTWINEAVCQSL